MEGKSDVGVSKHFTHMSDTYASPNTTPTRHRRKILLVQFGILGNLIDNLENFQVEFISSP